jgi:serine phosphatase RsbU (regulator of sigma subunit)/anti-sigma regulatory factor (Ser/Thr protein kinase)
MRNFWRWLRPHRNKGAVTVTPAPPAELHLPQPATGEPPSIQPGDPFLAYVQEYPGIVDLEKLTLDSPAVRELRVAGVRLVAPLVSQGELIGLLNLGPRLSEQEYTSDDLRLLSTLTSQTAPALRVAQLVQQQRLEALQRERIEQELRVARIIQETLLPRELPTIDGWRLDAFWQPAQAVGGDFYDFIGLPAGKLGIVIGDVTDKGVPAALVMASTRSILRAAAERHSTPGQVLARVNTLLHPEIPPKMFVTCLYAIFDPVTGRFWFANAGHNLPALHTAGGVVELRARGMPLGLLPDMEYEEVEATLAPGDVILLYSDGLAEAHNEAREMYGFPRVLATVGAYQGGQNLVQIVRTDLERFVGESWEQEDDVTLVVLERLDTAAATPTEQNSRDVMGPMEEKARLLAEFSVPSERGNERQVMEQVASVVGQELALPPRTLERVKTAVAEGAMNAIEHGNQYQADLPTDVQVWASAQQLVIRIADHGESGPIPPVPEPDLQAKLEGLQSPRGWGLFLIKSMVDELRIQNEDEQHTIELVFNLVG